MGKYVFKKHSLPTTKSCPLIKPADTSSCATPSGVSSEWKWLASQKNTNAPLCSNNNKLTQCWVSYLSCNESQATHNLWTILNAVEQSKKEFQALHCSSAISSNLFANVPTVTFDVPPSRVTIHVEVKSQRPNPFFLRNGGLRARINSYKTLL